MWILKSLRWGKKRGVEPYLYGVAFKPNQPSWEMINALQTRAIPHTLPLKIHAKNGDVSFSWSIITLGNFLDNGAKVPYGINWMFGNNFYTHIMSRFFSTLMKSDAISKASTKDVGESSLFFCEYHNMPQKHRDEARTAFIQNGGKYDLTGVESIMIEKEPNNASWEKLGTPLSKDSLLLEFMESDKNRLNHIRLKSKKPYGDKEIMIGNVRFVIS